VHLKFVIQVGIRRTPFKIPLSPLSARNTVMELLLCLIMQGSRSSQSWEDCV